jgi:AAA family ATP:ADP antiporter
MLKRIAQTIWGKFESKDEIIKFSLLGLIFGLIIGCYWTLRPIKDSIFAAMVGVDYQPMAKWLSLVIVSTLVLVYGKLIDTFSRDRVFYILTVIYALAAFAFAWAFSNPEIGLQNTTLDPMRITGWLWYVYVESFGSLIVALFWSFTTDITDENAAKRGFPLIAMLGQLGNILGPLFLRAEYLGYTHSGPVVAIGGVMTLAIGVLVWIFMRVVPASQLVGYESKEETKHGKHHAKHEEEPGFFEGLRLLFTQPYLLGIFLIITIYEVVITIIDFQLKAAARSAYPSEKAMANFLADFGVMTGVISMACVLLGINSIQRILGTTASLVFVPLLVAAGVVAVWVHPTLSIVFWVMAIGKAINYALNQPTIKQLYIPTTKDTKYKATAWIEMFGSRGAKASGSGVNAFKLFLTRKYGAAGTAMFLNVSVGASLGLIGVWLLVVMYVARIYNKAIAKNEVVC